MELQTFEWTPSGGWSAPLGVSDSPQTLVFAFGSTGIGERPEPLRELSVAYSHSHVIGCSTAGQVLGTGLSDDGLVVAVARFDKTSITSAYVPIGNTEDSFRAGRDVAKSLMTDDLRAVFVICDGLQVNGSELARGIVSEVASDVIVTGGLAGDDARFSSTWVLVDGAPVPGFVSAVGLSGPQVCIGHGSRGGWDIFGPERLVTRSSSNVLYELDGRPALEIYRAYLGDLAAGLPATALLFPLALRTKDHDDEQLVRTVLSVNDAEQSMTFAGDIPEGAMAQLMHANLDRLISGASDAAQSAEAMIAHSDSPMLAIAVSCVGRRLVLGERSEEELEATFSQLPTDSSQIGFYSYGELSPTRGGVCELHNQTMTFTTISES